MFNVNRTAIVKMMIERSLRIREDVICVSYLSTYLECRERGMEHESAHALAARKAQEVDKELLETLGLKSKNTPQ